jgi:hypothetical protein
MLLIKRFSWNTKIVNEDIKTNPTGEIVNLETEK